MCRVTRASDSPYMIWMYYIHGDSRSPGPSPRRPLRQGRRRTEACDGVLMSKYAKDKISTQTSSERPLGITILSAGGRTTVPRQVREALKLKPEPHERVKLLWTREGNEVIVSKGTLQSSYKKTILSRSGRAAVPKHVREVLKLESTPHKEERMIWVQKGNEIIVRKGMPGSTSTD